MRLQERYVHVFIQEFTVGVHRLIEDEERQWTDENVNAVALKNFPNINQETALRRPILFSNWLSKDYIPVDREKLREYVKARLKVWPFSYFGLEHFHVLMQQL